MLEHETLPDNLPGFNISEGLNRVTGNSELYKNLLHSFYLDNREKAAQIQHALQAKDFSTARHLVHAVKGLSGNISANRLFSASSNLEQQLNQEFPQGLTELLDQFTAALDEVLNSLAFLANSKQSIINSTAVTDHTPISWNIINENIKELAALLGEFNMDAEKSFRTLKKQLSQQQYQPTMHNLDLAITQLKFDLATEILSELADKLNFKPS